MDRVAAAWEKKALRRVRDRQETTSQKIIRFDRKAAEIRKHLPRGQSYIVHCRSCGAHIPGCCPMKPGLVHRRSLAPDGTLIIHDGLIEEKPFPCPTCKKDPRYRGKVEFAPHVKSDLRGFWATDFPDTDPAYVDGKGIYIGSMSEARSYAKKYGMRIH